MLKNWKSIGLLVFVLGVPAVAWAAKSAACEDCCERCDDCDDPDCDCPCC